MVLDSGELYFPMQKGEWRLKGLRMDDAPPHVLLSIQTDRENTWMPFAMILPYGHETAKKPYKILDSTKSLDKPSTTLAEIALGINMHRGALKARLQLNDYHNFSVSICKLVHDILLRRWRNQLIDRINKDEKFAEGLSLMTGLTKFIPSMLA